MDLKEKVAVVVGATGGMGSELCKRLYSEGVKMILVSRSEDKLKELSAKLGNCDYFTVDLNKPGTIADLCQKITLNNNRLDFLFNAAGIGVYKAIEDVTEDDWQDSINTNVTAVFYFTKYLLPSLKAAEKAVVFNFGSGMGVIPTAGRSVYCMTKSALRGLSLSLSKEFEGTEIKIVHLSLGSVLTDFGPLTLEEKKQESLQGKAYLTPQSVVEKIISVMKNDQLLEEIVLYPTDYSE